MKRRRRPQLIQPQSSNVWFGKMYSSNSVGFPGREVAQGFLECSLYFYYVNG